MNEETKVEVKVDDKEKPVVVTNDNLKDLDIKQDKKVETKTTTEETVTEETKVEETKDEIDYKAKLDELNNQLQSISNQVKEKENKIKEFEQKEYDRLLEENEKILSKFNINKDNQLYDRVQKVKDEFIFPKDGEKLTKEQIEQNIRTFRIIEKTEIFNEIDKIKIPVIPYPSERKKTINDLRLENNPILR